MISSKAHAHVASAVGGKTARACDSCIRKRARWYCAADDAFLCQSCDSSVHSANPLARRHERVRLKTASLKSLSVDTNDGSASVIQQQQPSWVRGVTKKARTPRPNNNNNKMTSSPPPPNSAAKPIEETTSLMLRGVPLVPEVGSDEMYNNEEEEEEHQLLYRVPIFDPIELCNNNNNSSNDDDAIIHHHRHQNHQQTTSSMDSSCLQGLVLPSDMDFADFAADVESLLGRGLDNESFGMDELGILDSCSKLIDDGDDDDDKLVKMEKEEDHVHGCNYGGIDLELMEMAKVEDEGPPFQLSFEYDDVKGRSDAINRGDQDNMNSKEELELEEHDDSTTAGDGDHSNSSINGDKHKKKRKRNNILLSLNYEAVITAWSTTTPQGSSPWTNGLRPDFDLNQCWPDCLGGCGREYMHHHNQQQHQNHGYEGGFAVGGNSGGGGDGGREARVSRYREKRRTRLFSKKIRYEVRKLNAEKRPRMKGRFVKRTTSTSNTTTTNATSPLMLQPYTSSLLLNNNNK